MASIVKVKVGNHLYLYESISFRNKEGKPRNHRVIVGKVDKKSGEYVYKQEYIDRKKSEGIIIEPAKSIPIYSVNDIEESSVLQKGAVHLLNGISDNIGLSKILKETFNKDNTSEDIFSVASYLLSSGAPVSYCEDWMSKSDYNNNQILSSQKISKLFKKITDNDIEKFYKAWGDYRAEREYLALDITSISSWSKLIDDVEWGYNRDGDKLAQINLSMLLGLESKLPIRATVYDGSISDVSTLKTSIKQIASKLEKPNQLMIVMDKGFSSKKNINMLLESDDLKFLLALPFTLNFTKKIIESAKKNINTFENTVVSGGDIIRGVTLERSWSKGKNVFVHAFYNDIKAAVTKNNLYGYVRKLVTEAELDPENKKLKNQFKHYLIIRKSSKRDSGYTVNVKQDVLDSELKNAGWLVTISNDINNATDAIRIYRDKDVVEKGFMRFKNSLGLKRLRVHSQQAMNSKVFVTFIALILSSHIHKVMLDNDLYKSMTMKDLLQTMEKLKVQLINDDRILFPLSKKQKDIYKFFKVDPPS